MGYIEKKTITIMELLENNYKIFDFDYPFFREEYRETFQKHFIDYFMFDEIAHETPSRWKHRLKIKLNLIMPYWNKVFLADELEQRILDNYDMTEVYTVTTTNTNSSKMNNSNKDMFSNTPKGKVDINTFDSFSSINKNVGDSSQDSEGVTKTIYENHKTGNYGVQTDADAIIKYWESLRKIELEIFEELSVLFMGVY